SFNDANGARPESGVTVDGAGNLYGTTYFGGSADDGVVFEIPTGSNTITTLASFDGNNGVHPKGALTLDADGSLYGTTAGDYFTTPGGDRLGTVFEIPKGGDLVTLASFNGH